MTRKAVQLAISPRPDAGGGVVDVLYVLFDDGEVRQIWHDGDEWRWSATGPSASCDEPNGGDHDVAERDEGISAASAGGFGGRVLRPGEQSRPRVRRRRDVRLPDQKSWGERRLANAKRK